MTSSRVVRGLLAMASVCMLVAVPMASAGTSTAPEAAPTGRAAVPQPTVTGPLTGGVHGWPFMGLLSVPHGYVQEEYLVSGMARPYYGPSVFAQRPVPGIAQLPPLPYTTRIIVVRLTEPQRSNRTAVVTWQNVTFGHDIDQWFDIGRQVAADGYTYVDASVQIA